MAKRRKVSVSDRTLWCLREAQAVAFLDDGRARTFDQVIIWAVEGKLDELYEGWRLRVPGST